MLRENRLPCLKMPCIPVQSMECSRRGEYNSTPDLEMLFCDSSYLEGAIGHPPLVLEQIEHLGQNGVECHGPPSAWTWGSHQDAIREEHVLMKLV